jgi:hypothetical protein
MYSKAYSLKQDLQLEADYFKCDKVLSESKPAKINPKNLDFY